MTTLLHNLGDFLCQTPDENVALTGVLSSLALCTNRSLTGWLAYDIPDTVDPWAEQRLPGQSDGDSNDGSNNGRSVLNREENDPFTTRNKVDLPAIYQILRDIVRQINRFRQDVEDFDRLLGERRQGLLFTDSLEESMNVMLDVEQNSLGPPTTPTKLQSPSAKKARPGLVGGLKSFLTPKRKGSPATPNRASPLNRSTSNKDATGLGATASPFRSHYEQTSYFSLEAQSSPPVSSGPWSLANLDVPTDASTVDVMSLTSAEDRAKRDDLGPRRVTLSSVLDNCVILEEFLKEIVAVITARRALGVDQVDFAS